MKRKNKNTKLERASFREATDSGDGITVGKFSGYLAVYGNRDSYDSTLIRGAFAKSVAEHDSFPLLADHDSTQVIGKFSAKEDDHGLRIEADIFLGIEKGMEKWIALKAKAIDGLSVGFSCIREEWDSVLKITKILEARLWEGSVVTFPANDLATVDAMRSMEPQVREVLEPLVLVAEEIKEAVKVFGRAIGADEKAKAQALDILDRASEKIEALREKIESAAAEGEQDASAESHPSEISKEDSKELSEALERIKVLIPTAQRATN